MTDGTPNDDDFRKMISEFIVASGHTEYAAARAKITALRAGEEIEPREVVADDDENMPLDAARRMWQKALIEIIRQDYASRWRLQPNQRKQIENDLKRYLASRDGRMVLEFAGVEYCDKLASKALRFAETTPRSDWYFPARWEGG